MDCYAAGWGKTRTADSTRQAHQTAITLISNETCENVYNIKYSKEEMVCTGGMNRPCQGDGGAPLVSFIEVFWKCFTSFFRYVNQ